MAQWQSSSLRTKRFQVQNQVNALVPFGEALILITQSLKKNSKLSVPQLLTYKHITRFLISWVKQSTINQSISILIFFIWEIGTKKEASHAFLSLYLVAYLATGGCDGRISVWSVSPEGDVTGHRELDVWMETDEILVQALTWVHALCVSFEKKFQDWTRWKKYNL